MIDVDSSHPALVAIQPSCGAKTPAPARISDTDLGDELRARMGEAKTGVIRRRTRHVPHTGRSFVVKQPAACTIRRIWAIVARDRKRSHHVGGRRALGGRRGGEVHGGLAALRTADSRMQTGGRRQPAICEELREQLDGDVGVGYVYHGENYDEMCGKTHDWVEVEKARCEEIRLREGAIEVEAFGPRMAERGSQGHGRHRDGDRSVLPTRLPAPGGGAALVHGDDFLVASRRSVPEEMEEALSRRLQMESVMIQPRS